MEIVESIFRSLMVEGLYIVGPILIITFIGAVLIGIIQSMMQIQEQTLSFAPKLILIGVLVFVLSPTIYDRLTTSIKEALEMAINLL